MDRNREGRRSGMVASAATSNGLSSRRRHNRSNSLRDSPDEDGGVEIQESARLRERVKKDRDRERDRERDNRDRDRTNRSKRRRGVGDDSSEESVNDDEEEDDEDNTTSNSVVAVGVSASSTRSLQPAPATVGSISNHHHHHHHHHYNNNNLHHLQPPRKSFPPKVFRAAAPVWKPGDEMIGVSVPRKARSASTKRSHDWISGTGGVVTGDQIHQQASTTSPARQNIPATSTTPSPAAPLSPSSSNVSSRKKIKSCNGPKRPPVKSPPKAAATSSNPEELEIEIAEVLYGLKTQSQQGPPSKKESGGPNDASREVNNRSRVSSPASNSNSSAAPPLLAVAPKRKRPRQVLENPGGFGIRSSPISPSATSNKVEMMDQATLKMEVSSPNNNLEKSATENGLSFSTSDPVAEPMKVESEGKRRPEESEFVESKEEVISPKKESSSVVAENSNSVVVAATHVSIVTEVESQREDKFPIDLMAPPPQLRSSPEREAEMGRGSVAVDNKPILAENLIEMKPLDDEKAQKVERVSIEGVEEKKTKAAAFEEVNPHKTSGSNFDLQLDLERPEKDSGISSKFQQQSQKLQQQQQPPPPQKESISDKAGLPSSLPMPMSMASWPGGLPPMGYMAPLQGVVAMDGTAVSSAPIQPLFSQPRPKRCATHCYIARNIHYHQQFMKMHHFWPPATASSAPFFGPKSNLSVMPIADLHGNLSGRGVSAVPEKGQGLASFPTSNNCGKDKVQPPNIADAAQRKQQQMLLQQALPPVAPNNLLHGPAFIFPLNHQQQAMAAAAVRPGPARSPSTMGTSVSSNASNPSAGSAPSATAATAISFNYPNISPNEAQYLAILQNNAYAFPIPAAPPNYRGTHPQPLPLFNPSFYPSQMIHPSQVPPQQQQQLQQPPPPTSQSQQMQQQGQQNTSMSSGGSSSSQKHLHNQQQRSQGNAVNGGSGGGNLHNYHGSKNHPSQSSAQSQNQHVPSQPRQIENEVGSESPSSASERKRSHGSTNLYNQNFAMPIHPSNFGLMTPPATFGVASSAGGSSSSHQMEKKPQQQPGVKTSLDSVPPQPFAMSFSSFNGASAAPGIDLSMAQNHAIFQSLPEATRQNIQMAAAAAAQAVQQKKNFRVSEDGKPGSGSDQSGADAERKSLAMKPSGNAGGQSIAFSRPDMSDASGSSSTIAANSVIDSSSRSLNLPSGASWNARAAMPNAMGAVNVPNAQLQAQFQHQQQQMIQLHKQQQQQQQQMAAAAVARSKAPTSTNGNVYSDHFTSSASAASKYPNSMSAIPQNLVQTGNSVQAQLTQWKSANRAATTQAPSSMSSSSLKNPSHQQQQQQARTQQTLTQISFGTNPKSGGPSQGQQPPNSNQSPSSPMMVGSPTTSSISRGASGSPRTTNSASTSNKTGQNSSLSTQQQQPGKSSPSGANQKSSPAAGRNVPSILGGNPHHIASTSSGGSKSQMQQQQLYFSSPYVQAQPPPHASGTSSTGQPTGGYYIQRRRSDQAGQLPPGSSASSGMLTLCPVNLGGGGSTTSDPAKAIAAAAAANNNMKGGVLPSQGIHQYARPTSGSQHPVLPAGFSYHPVPAAVQVKPSEQKQPAGNDNLHACWQPEKK